MMQTTKQMQLKEQVADNNIKHSSMVAINNLGSYSETARGNRLPIKPYKGAENLWFFMCCSVTIIPRVASRVGLWELQSNHMFLDDSPVPVPAANKVFRLHWKAIGVGR